MAIATIGPETEVAVLSGRQEDGKQSNERDPVNTYSQPPAPNHQSGTSPIQDDCLDSVKNEENTYFGVERLSSLIITDRRNLVATDTIATWMGLRLEWMVLGTLYSSSEWGGRAVSVSPNTNGGETSSKVKEDHLRQNTLLHPEKQYSPFFVQADSLMPTHRHSATYLTPTCCSAALL